MALLEIRDMHTSYGNIKAVKGISFEVDQGEIVTLIGSNGAGKSTTLNTIVGTVPMLILFFFFKTIIWGDPVAGFPATICIILLLGGIQLFCIGILGQYLSKTYLETKRRPIYIAREIAGKGE